MGTKYLNLHGIHLTLYILPPWMRCIMFVYCTVHVFFHKLHSYHRHQKRLADNFLPENYPWMIPSGEFPPQTFPLLEEILPEISRRPNLHHGGFALKTFLPRRFPP